MHAHPRCVLHPKCLSLRHIFARRASVSSKHPLPFPHGTSPTPHEIFHLPRSASQDEIKTRYYELVKLYHPDAAHDQRDVSPSVRNARFRAITHAYGILHGRSRPSSNETAHAWNYYESRDEAIRAELRRRARRSGSTTATATAGSSKHGNTVDSQVGYTVIAIVLAGLFTAMGSVSSHTDRVERHTQSAAANLAQARTDAQIYGMERRRKIREHVRAFHEARETMDETEHTDMHQPKARLAELSRRETGSRKVPDDAQG